MNTTRPGNEPARACSVVVRAYNEAGHIGRLVSGLVQQTLPELEIILVDSGSTDGTLEVAAAALEAACQEGASAGRTRSLQGVRIQPGEFTFGRSLNLGISSARHERVAIASAHVYPVYPDWLERLLAPFSDPQVVLAYGKQRGAPASHFSEHQIFARWFPEVSRTRQPTPFCNNANAAIRRSAWQARPYDETLSGLEDLDWANWALKAGFALAYCAEAEIIHVHDETPGGVYNRYRREAMAFKRIFPQERFGQRDLVRLVVSNIASDLFHAARQGALAAHWKSIFWFRWMQFWGTYQGYRHPGPLTWQLRQTFYYPRSIADPGPIPARDVEPIRYNE